MRRTYRKDDRGVVEVLDVNRYDLAHPNADVVTCGACGRSWDDAVSTAWTPAPSARCPFEYDHGADAVAAAAWDYDARGKRNL